ncbi:MAG: hypothetical protein J5911_02420 [Clostridia bacterium]|nr:hypothetical protein [Clostridia bacterium]
MKSWILSVFSSVLLVSLLSLILPEGKITRFVKPFIFLSVITVILYPLSNIQKFLNEAVFDNNKIIETDKSFLMQITISKIDLYSANCIKIAENCGINGSEIKIEYNVSENYEPIINGVQINLENAVITAKDEHIVILQTLKKSISNYLRIDETGVKINEFPNK